MKSDEVEAMIVQTIKITRENTEDEDFFVLVAKGEWNGVHGGDTIWELLDIAPEMYRACRDVAARGGKIRDAVEDEAGR